MYSLRFSTMIRQLKEFGLIQHWKKIEMDKVAKITQNGDSAAEFKGLTLSNLQVHIYFMIYFKHFIYSKKAPFYIFLFLNMIAIITFMVEVVFEELDKRMNKAKSRDNGTPKQFLLKQASLKQIFK